MELRTHLRPGEERKRKRLQVLTDNRFCCVTLNNLPAVFFKVFHGFLVPHDAWPPKKVLCLENQGVGALCGVSCVAILVGRVNTLQSTAIMKILYLFIPGFPKII